MSSINIENSFLRLTRRDLNKIKDLDERRQQFYYMIHYASLMNEQDDKTVVTVNILQEKNIFPSDDDYIYFLQLACRHKQVEVVKFLQKYVTDLKIHEVRFSDGKSALQYVSESTDAYSTSANDNKEFIDLLLRDATENYSDEHGYTYLHEACKAGKRDVVLQFIEQKVDVNIDTYKCSPLHIAAQHRHIDIVWVLLKNEADPNQRDHEESTPLHALARRNLCGCTTYNKFCDRRKAADRIVGLLVGRKAKINAINCNEDTPLQVAASRFDVELARALIKQGAHLDWLDKFKLFDAEFESFELKNYPLTLNMVEMVRLLESRGVDMDIHDECRMLKCWLRVRGNDTDHLVDDLAGTDDSRSYDTILKSLYIFKELGFYIKQKGLDYLQQQREQLRSSVLQQYIHENLPQDFINQCASEVEELKNIMVSEDVSLYQICQMDYREGHLVLKNIKDWCVPELHDLRHLKIIVKRHLANILIRPYFERFATQVFAKDYCDSNQLDLDECRSVAEYMRDEDLLSLYERTSEEDLDRNYPMPARKRRRSYYVINDPNPTGINENLP
ncbi:hypothetical protein TKK_0019646 [Trichogramma kaykai]